MGGHEVKPQTASSSEVDSMFKFSPFFFLSLPIREPIRFFLVAMLSRMEDFFRDTTNI